MLLFVQSCVVEKTINQYTEGKKQNIAVALWLVNNTKLNPEQIAKTAKIHLFEAILLYKQLCDFDYEPISPVRLNVISEEQIRLMESSQDRTKMSLKVQKRYIPKPLRKYIPGAVVWLSQQYPTISHKTISAYLGTTTKKVQSIIADETVSPINPLLVQIIDQKMLNNMINT